MVVRNKQDLLCSASCNISKTRASCFITISKHEKTGESMRPLQPSAFIVFECLEIMMKHDARVFEMTSLKKQYKIMWCYIFAIFV